MTDRRMFARIEIKIPLRFCEPGNGKEARAEAVDISASGIGFITRESLVADTPLEMWLDIPDNHEPLHLQGTVVWSRKIDNQPEQRVGVSLEKQEFIGIARIFKHQYSS